MDVCTNPQMKLTEVCATNAENGGRTLFALFPNSDFVVDYLIFA